VFIHESRTRSSRRGGLTSDAVLVELASSLGVSRDRSSLHAVVAALCTSSSAVAIVDSVVNHKTFFAAIHPVQGGSKATRSDSMVAVGGFPFVTCPLESFVGNAVAARRRSSVVVDLLGHSLVCSNLSNTGWLLNHVHELGDLTQVTGDHVVRVNSVSRRDWDWDEDRDEDGDDDDRSRVVLNIQSWGSDVCFHRGEVSDQWRRLIGHREIGRSVAGGSVVGVVVVGATRGDSVQESNGRHCNWMLKRKTKIFEVSLEEFKI